MEQRAVLFADVVGSTALYRRLGDERAEALIRGALERVADAAIRRGGRLIKTIGDCAMCELPDADAAAHASIEVQRQAREPRQDGELPVQFRVGFTLGPVVSREDDVFGDAVNVAARLCDMAKAEQVLTTEATSALLSPELRGSVRLFDQTPVKGITQSLMIVQLLWDRRAATQIFIAPSEVALPASTGLLLKYGAHSILIAAQQMPYTIGREEGCSLVVPSPFASRVHARIEMHRGKYTLVDESTNGTYVRPEGADADKFVYIRREVFTLLGRGVFALGERPDEGLAHLLSYEVS
ncbi:MAG: adenylate/guanylate cyclase domain-containing protein [Sinimarinibacterium flocculans]|uniref:Class 3 adenylate cyclase n=1 Tax=Sinimarinibacterium flocculans TaxID=985250 RepID=A0A318EAT0_9GAMM|nr:adenylate/guanylate cyclase domain-containing protein [Sinimarinibacterium flocculans]MEC9361583.1 adenylate/guanylate cyclase domain-containing protein [Pseudomonadota bacterium]PXV69623.1 class 3 adenylate cyclase [Sinimarinibacterium flocculans]